MLLVDILPIDRYVTAAYLCAMANAQLARSPAAPKGNEVYYTDPKYWNGLIKMSLSKFFILCVLNRQRMHGYDITKAVEDTTQGCCSDAGGAVHGAEGVRGRRLRHGRA